jgi:hypothetical protein
MTLHFHSVLPYIFIALLVLPIPILILSTPIDHLYEKWMRYRYLNVVKKYCENPFDVSEEQLRKIFQGKSSEELNRIAYYLEEDFSYLEN